MSDRKTLQNRNKLEDIRPARGVKIKQKETPKKEVIQNKPRIIQDIDVSGEIPLPTEDALKILERSSVAKENLLLRMKDFNDLLKIRILPENKTDEDKRREQDVVSQLARAAMNVDEYSPKEGLLSLCILAIRQALSLRDAGNELAYKIIQFENRLKKIEEKSTNVETSKKEPVDAKKQMLEISDLLKKLANGDH
jgi:hypothetical protein